MFQASTFKTLYIAKQILLGISMLYFYGLAFFMIFHRTSFELDAPTHFLFMAALFVAGLLIEGILTWWHARLRIFWFVLAAICYALVGLYVLPRFMGQESILVALALPVFVVFVGGWFYVFATIFFRLMSRRRLLPIGRIRLELLDMPGWDYVASVLEKTYRFETQDDVRAFAERCMVLGQKHHKVPEYVLSKDAVRVQLTSFGGHGITASDITLAKEIDAL